MRVADILLFADHLRLHEVHEEIQHQRDVPIDLRGPSP